MSAQEPQIVVEPTMLFCQEHLEPFRAAWPSGYAPAMLCLFQQAMLDEEIVAAAGGRVEAISAVLREFGPICCRLDADSLREIVEGSLAGGDRMMEVVRKYGPPPPAQTERS